MSGFAADAYSARYWQGGGSPTTVITTEQDLTNTQADAIGERWRSRRVKGPDFPAVMGKGAKAEPWGADVSGASAVEARREITIEVANLFGVPARYVNVPIGGSSQTYANLNDESLSLERYTLSGFVDPIEDCISDLLPDPNIMKVDLSRLTRAGQEARFRAWMMALGQKPWIMPSEVRRVEGLPENADIERMEQATVDKSEASADVLEAQADAQEAQSEGVANAV
jgi:HK97 family phage portal protein